MTPQRWHTAQRTEEQNRLPVHFLQWHLAKGNRHMHTDIKQIQTKTTTNKQKIKLKLKENPSKIQQQQTKQPNTSEQLFNLN